MRDSLIADSDDIKFECSQCGQHMVVERSAAGQTADCPICSTPLTVPPLSSAAAEPVNEAAPAAEAVPPSQSEEEPKWKSAQQLEEELAKAHEEIARQHALFKKAVDECERLNASSTHVQAEAKSFQTDRQQLKSDAAQARQALMVAEGRISELIDTLSATQAENGALRYQTEVDVTALHERVLMLETQLTACESELQQGKAEHTDALRSLAKKRAEFSKVSTEASALRSEVEVLRQNFESTTQELASTSQHLFDIQGRFDTLTEEHQVATAERDDWRQQAEGLRHDLGEIDNGRELLELRAHHTELQHKNLSLENALADQAEAAKKDNEVLRGIVARQNATLDSHHVELRRLRRSRFALRLVYALFFLGLLALGYLAFSVFAPQQLMKAVQQILGQQ